MGQSRNRWAAVLLVGALSVGGCTQVDRAAAIKLGETGKSASAAAASEAALARAEFVANGERSAALVLVGRVGNDTLRQPRDFELPAAADDAAVQRGRISAVLRKREEALSRLSATYAVMGALAASDPGADARKAATELFESTNGLIAVANTLPVPGAALVQPLSRTAGAIFAEAAALYAEERQRREILAASAAIADVLPKIRAVMRREAEFSTAIRTETSLLRTRLAAALHNEGLVDHAAALSRMAELAGVSPSPNAGSILSGASVAGDAVAQRRQRVVWALTGFEIHRANRVNAAAADAAEALDRAFEGLENAHSSLAKGGAPDLAAVLAWAERLKEALDRVKAAQAGS